MSYCSAMEPTAAPERATTEAADGAETVAERVAAEHKLDVTPAKPQAGKGKPGLAREPRGLRQRPGSRDPDHRARVRRLRHGGQELPRGPAVRGAVHRLPAQAGRVRPAPARRADDSREAADGWHHPRADGDLRRRDRRLRAPEQGAHHDAPEHPDPSRAPPRCRRPDQAHLRCGALLAGGMRQHRPQRHRRPVRRRHRGRALRHHPLRRGRTCATSSATRRRSSCRAR